MCPENSAWMLERLISQGIARWTVDSRFAQGSPVSLLICLRQGRQVGVRPLKQYAADGDLVLLNRTLVRVPSLLQGAPTVPSLPDPALCNAWQSCCTAA
jgi:hypothetical protein